jgi:hypothetical protein
MPAENYILCCNKSWVRERMNTVFQSPSHFCVPSPTPTNHHLYFEYHFSSPFTFLVCYWSRQTEGVQCRQDTGAATDLNPEHSCLFFHWPECSISFPAHLFCYGVFTLYITDSLLSLTWLLNWLQGKANMRRPFDSAYLSWSSANSL